MYTHAHTLSTQVRAITCTHTHTCQDIHPRILFFLNGLLIKYPNIYPTQLKYTVKGYSKRRLCQGSGRDKVRSVNTTNPFSSLLPGSCWTQRKPEGRSYYLHGHRPQEGERVGLKGPQRQPAKGWQREAFCWLNFLQYDSKTNGSTEILFANLYIKKKIGTPG